MRPNATRFKSRFLLFFLILIAIQLCKCENPNTRYLYTRPHSLVFDTVSHTVLNNYDSLNFNKHLVTMLMPVDEYAFKLSWPFSTSVYAVSRKYPNVKLEESITSISIITLNDYSPLFPAGSDISDSCTFYANTSYLDTGSYSSPLYPETKAQMLAYFNTGYQSQPVQRFSFRINMPPNTSAFQQLAIVFETSTPSRFSDTTIYFKLKP